MPARHEHGIEIRWVDVFDAPRGTQGVGETLDVCREFCNLADIAVPANPVFVTDDPEAECEAVLAGIGFGQLPRHLAAPYLLDRRLVSMLEGLGPASTTVYVYRPQRTPVSARVRLVFDALCELLDDRTKQPSGDMKNKSQTIAQSTNR
ncbi:MAG TPA: LysR substrate-binding domain-containing protein [Trinickia sp.]|jgi:DNA-binding transcriptional LysR family regulator|nr:LysR substrate-binding domain-containing protein [Trinickia sp.]